MFVFFKFYRCDSIENTELFFLYCRYHQAQRDELLSVITPYQVPTTYIFPYVYGNLSEQTNTLIDKLSLLFLKILFRLSYFL